MNDNVSKEIDMHSNASYRIGRTTFLGPLLAVLSILGVAGADGPDLWIGTSFTSLQTGEGRDNLDGESLVETAFEASGGMLAVGVTYASSPGVDCRELSATATCTAELGVVDAFASFTHLRFLTDEEYDNELGAGFSTEALPAGLSACLEGCFSFEAEGAFIEASIAREFEAGCFNLAPSLALGWNEGYVADGHDGVNHFASTLEISVPLRDGLDLALAAGGSWAVNADPERYADDVNLKNLGWFGLTLGGSF